MKCTPIKNCTKPVCEWSQWSQWSNCTDKCNGESRRYRTEFGENCKKNQTEEQTRPCNDCKCLIDGNSYEVINYINPVE